MGLLDLLSEAIAFAGCLFIFYITLNVIVNFAKKAMQVKMPQMKNDAFLKENGYSWSFVFVYKVFDEDQKVSLTSDQLKFSMKNVIERLNTAGFDTSCFFNLNPYNKNPITTNNHRIKPGFFEMKIAV